MRAVGSLVALALGAAAACSSFSSTTGSPTDAGGDASPIVSFAPGTACQGPICSPSMFCCLTRGESGWFAPAAGRCLAGCPVDFSKFACDDGYDCADAGLTFCCATRPTSSTSFDHSACVARSQCPDDGLHVVACNPSDQAPCPDGMACRSADPEKVVPGWFVCQRL